MMESHCENLALLWRSSIQSAKTRQGADCGSDHELLIAKFRLKLKKIEIDGETVETVSDFILGAPKSLQIVNAAMKLKHAYSLEGKL